MTETAPPASPKKKTATLLWAGAVVVLLFLLFAAVATPKFVGFQCRSKQNEAKANLKALRVAEEAFLAKANTYSDDLSAIGFTAHGSGRYVFGFTTADGATFRLNDPSTPHLKQLAASDVRSLLMGAVAGPKAFKAFAVGNIDSDETLDIWTISEKNDLDNLVSDCGR